MLLLPTPVTKENNKAIIVISTTTTLQRRRKVWKPRGPAKIYSTPRSCAIPKLRYFHSYAIFIWIQKNQFKLFSSFSLQFAISSPKLCFCTLMRKDPQDLQEEGFSRGKFLKSLKIIKRKGSHEETFPRSSRQKILKRKNSQKLPLCPPDSPAIM